MDFRRGSEAHNLSVTFGGHDMRDIGNMVLEEVVMRRVRW